MKRFRKLGIGGGLALIGVVALAVGAVSLAFHNSSAATTKNSASTTRNNDPPWAGGGGPPWMGHRHFGGFSSKDFRDRREKFHAELAKELGVSTAKVDQAFRNLLANHLDQAVHNGNLTSKQRDRILKCYDTGKCEGGPPMGRPGGYGPPGGGPGFGPPM